MIEFPEVCIIEKKSQEYLFQAWLSEARSTKNYESKELAVVIVKPRLVSAARRGEWYALMYQDEFDRLSMGVDVWVHEMRATSSSTYLGSCLKLARAHQSESDKTHSCVLVSPKRSESNTLPYVCTNWEQMADLLVRAGYGRRDDPTGA